MSGNRDIARFRRDARGFGKSVAGHLPGIGRALGIHDTYRKGRKLANSTPKAISASIRKVRAKVGRRIRRATRRIF